MKLNDEEKAAIQTAVATVKAMNEALQRMRILNIACSIHEIRGHWLLYMNPIIRKEHYQ